MSHLRITFLGLAFAVLLTQGASAQPAGRLAGSVTEAEGNRPLAGVILTLVPGEYRAASAADGSFAFPLVPVGSYQLSASSIGYAPASVPVMVASGEQTNVDIVLSAGDSVLDEVVVEGREARLVGLAGSASEGRVGQAQLAPRPLLRVGEVLETVPGLIVTQHSGSGKANQFFLRGFNLDHGTDFAASVEGVPFNLPTHAHGQGYLDLGSLIPEVVEEIAFTKGPLDAEAGDFATAGRADIRLARRLDRGVVRVSARTDDWTDGVVAMSRRAGRGDLLFAARGSYADGPWVNPENSALGSAVVKYSTGTDADGVSVTAMGYAADWDATDQVALRAVQSGQISRLGALDPTAGGTTGRLTLSGTWRRATAAAASTEVSAFAAAYRLNLFSNFTYFLDDPDQGDQFEQADRRLYTGATVRHRWQSGAATNSVGAVLRHDQIVEVGLYRTRERERLGTVRSDAVAQSSGGLFAQTEVRWAPRVRTTASARADVYRFGVSSGLAANSGTEVAVIASPRLGVVLGPWAATEVYLNAGLGFHSNDARGATIRLDPVSGEPAAAVDPLVRTRGAEVGVRTVALPGLQSTLSLWTLGLDSELVFVGDAGGTEASDASRHLGVEWTNYLRLADGLDAALDVALTRSRYTEAEGGADRIENSIGRVVTAGLYGGRAVGPHASLQVRHFGPRPLTGDGAVTSGSTTLVNGRVGYGFGVVRVTLDVLNALDSEDADVSYYYASRLPGEPAGGVEDVHVHPVIPRSVRGTLAVRL